MSKNQEKFTLTFFDDAAAFWNVAEEFLNAQEAAYGLILGLAYAMRTARRSVRAWIVSRDAQIQFLIFQTPPHNLILSAAPDLSSVSFAAREIASQFSAWAKLPPPSPLCPPDHQIPGTLLGLVGPVHEAEVFKTIWEQITGQSFHLGFRQRLHQARHVDRPTEIPGQLQIATLKHLDVVTHWSHQFLLEAVPNEATSLEDMNAAMKERIQASNVYLWIVDRKPVSQAAVSRPTARGIAVSLVYTPHECRGHGYASAVVAGLTEEQIKSGREFCLLFTDLFNPTSNSIYYKIGYRPVADSIHWVATKRS